MIAILLSFVALIGAAVILASPFIGLVLLAFFSQLEGVLEILGQGVPAMKALAAVTLAGTVLHLCREERDQRLALDEGATRWAVAFFLACVLSALFATDRSTALDTARRLATLVLLYYMVVKLCASQRRIELITLGIILSTIITSLTIIYDKASGGGLLAAYGLSLVVASDRLGDDSAYTATGSYVLAGTALSAWLLLHSSRLKPFLVAAFAIGTAGLVFSLSRNAAIGYAIGALWLLWTYRRSRHFAFALVASCGLALAVYAALPEEFAARLSALSPEGPKDYTLERRWGYHVIGLHLLEDHPLLGVGPGNFPIHYIDAENRWQPGHVFEYRALHNLYLAVLAETGAVGAFFFFGFLAASLHRCWSFAKLRLDDESTVYAQAIFFAFVLYLIVSITLPNLVSKYIWLFAGLAVAAGRVGHQLASEASAGCRAEQQSLKATSPGRRAEA